MSAKERSCYFQLRYGRNFCHEIYRVRFRSLSAFETLRTRLEKTDTSVGFIIVCTNVSYRRFCSSASLLIVARIAISLHEVAIDDDDAFILLRSRAAIYEDGHDEVALSPQESEVALAVDVEVVEQRL